MSRIVGDLKNFCRGGEPRLEPVQVEEVFRTTEVLALSHLRNRAKLEIDNRLPEPVMNCSTRLGQICLNLVLNAAQAFSDENPRTNRVILRAFTNRAGQSVLQVEDNGPGIPAHHLGRIFEPFFTTGKAGQGSGLGLSVCHQLVRSLGGTLTVESHSDSGTIFTATFPQTVEGFQSQVVEVEESSTQSQGARKQSARVLIVDDEERIGRMLERNLAGHHVQRTTRGLEALEWIRKGEDFDIVLCDIMMPELNGMDLLHRVREEAPDLESRFVFMTGGAFSSSARRF